MIKISDFLFSALNKNENQNQKRIKGANYNDMWKQAEVDLANSRILEKDDWELRDEEKKIKTQLLQSKVDEIRSNISMSDSKLEQYKSSVGEPDHNMFELCILSGRCSKFRIDLTDLYVKYAGTEFDLNIALKRRTIMQLRLEGEFYKADRIEKLMQKCKELRIFVVVDNTL